MRRSERADRGLPHAEGVAALECSQPSLERRLLRGQRRRRAARGENRHLGLFEEHRKSLYMVDVLVRDDERVELARLHVERRERRCGACGAETPTSISTAVPSETYRPQFPLDPLAML